MPPHDITPLTLPRAIYLIGPYLSMFFDSGCNQVEKMWGKVDPMMPRRTKVWRTPRHKTQLPLSGPLEPSAEDASLRVIWSRFQTAQGSPHCCCREAEGRGEVGQNWSAEFSVPVRQFFQSAQWSRLSSAQPV